jgi:hypothetical protein
MLGLAIPVIMSEDWLVLGVYLGFAPSRLTL